MALASGRTPTGAVLPGGSADTRLQAPVAMAPAAIAVVGASALPAFRQTDLPVGGVDAIVVVQAADAALVDALLTGGAIVGAPAGPHAAASVASLAVAAVGVFDAFDAALFVAMGSRRFALFVALATGLAALQAHVAIPIGAIHVAPATDAASAIAELAFGTIRRSLALGADPIEALFSGAIVVPGASHADRINAEGLRRRAVLVAFAGRLAFAAFAHPIGAIAVPETEHALPR